MKLRLFDDWRGTFHSQLPPEQFPDVTLERGLEVFVTPEDMKVLIEKPGT
ncbi:MAG: hypothetical protein HY292_12270 [Planctomycetes bacterium]|nr:hypothetical protein [Planctomycetota bacterium]